jgi:hypothetical protein
VSLTDPAVAGRKARSFARVCAAEVTARSGETPGLVEIARTGADISVGRYSSTAVPLMWSGAIAASPPDKAAAGPNCSSKAEQVPLLVPGQRQT